MKIVNFSVRRSVTTAMLMLALVVFGSVSYNRLAVNLLPDITYPSLTIKTEYEGAAPAEVEDVITKPIEESVGVVDNIMRVSSISRPGESYVILEFAWGTNMDFAGLNVREKLDLVMLPDDAEKPVLLKYDPSADPILRYGVSGNQTLSRSRLLIEEKVKPYLENIEGVAAVKINGGLEEEIYVELDSGKLNAFRLSITQVTQRLSQENINLTGGILDEGRRRYLVRTLSQFQRVDEIDDVIVARRGGANITLGDIARVYSGFKERTIITKLNGEEVIELAVYKAADANAVLVVDAVKTRMDEILPNVNVAGTKLEFTTVFDQSIFIRQSIDEVLNTAMLGGILAILILFLFLRNLKSTAIISLSIPISVIVTFFFMYLSDITINIMSLGGLALGIGMLVDSSIVVLESIQRYREEGMSMLESARIGAGSVGKAVVASTLTTVCVFLPIVFVEGVAGQLFSDLALTVTFSLSASLLVSLTLIPMLAAKQIAESLEAAADVQHKLASTHPVARFFAFIFRRIPAFLLGFVLLLLRGLWTGIQMIIWPLTFLFEKLYDVVQASYTQLIRFAIGHRLVILLLALAVLAAASFIPPFLGSELIPEVKQGQFFLSIEREQGTPLFRTQETVDLLTERIKSLDGVSAVFALTGLNLQTGMSVEEEKENAARLTVNLEPAVALEREDVILEQVRHIVEPLPGLDYKFSRPTFFSFKTPIEVFVQGYNQNVLSQVAGAISSEMAEINGLADLKTSTEAGNPEVQVRFNRDRLSAYGLTVQEVAQFMRNQILGDVATEFVRPEHKVDVRVRLAEEQRQTLADIRNLKIHTSSGAVIPLQAVAELEVTQGPAEIRRLNQQRVALISGNIEGRDLASVVEDIHQVLAASPMPPNFTAFLGGQSEEQAVAFQSMSFAILLAIFLVYLVMASQFESLLQPFIIMFSIPFSLIGVLLILLLTGQTISVVVFIGAIVLAGIVVNNAIVLIDCINQLREEGADKTQAVIRGCHLRFRPILMTTATTVLGLLPMAIGFGQGAELRTPMALTIIGGLLSSTLLTLVLVPVLYHLVVREK
ncbi:MAG: efflux RND transporter permease subunit [Acidobacteria bacterium]|nr:efflux RND transporter permease subunit [Acidobacteriota bacterium]